MPQIHAKHRQGGSELFGQQRFVAGEQRRCDHASARHEQRGDADPRKRRDHHSDGSVIGIGVAVAGRRLRQRPGRRRKLAIADHGDQCSRGAEKCGINGPCNAADMAANELAIPHQLDAGGIACRDRREVGLLEIAVSPERLGVPPG